MIFFSLKVMSKSLLCEMCLFIETVSYVRDVAQGPLVTLFEYSIYN